MPSLNIGCIVLRLNAACNFVIDSETSFGNFCLTPVYFCFNELNKIFSRINLHDSQKIYRHALLQLTPPSIIEFAWLIYADSAGSWPINPETNVAPKSPSSQVRNGGLTAGVRKGRPTSHSKSSMMHLR